jgi:transposase
MSLESVGKGCLNNALMGWESAAGIGLLADDSMVWTKQNCGRYDRRGQRYPSDLTNEEWTILEPLLPVPKGLGRPRRYSLREIMNGIRYVLRYGIPWDAMPKDLPPSSICYDYWRLLSGGGHMERINHHLVMADREKAARCQSDLGHHRCTVGQMRCATGRARL